MMRRRTITLLALFLLTGGPHSSFAQQDQQAAPATPYRIGIFSITGHLDYAAQTFPWDKETADILHARIQKDPALVLAYSDYDSALNKPRIKKPRRLWVGSVLRKKPNTELVYRMARERKADGVVMVWARARGTTGAAGLEHMPMTLYLIDVDRRQVYQREGTVGTVKKMAGRVFADFIKGRGAKA